MQFEWDLDKEIYNIKKHGVRFSLATECFSDPQSFALTDNKRSTKEARYYWIGKTMKGQLLTVRFTYRNGNIRIIGAANWREFRRKYYEKAKT